MRCTIRLISLAALGVQAACAPDRSTSPERGVPAAARAGYDDPGTHRQYGVPLSLGQGKVRAYVVLDARTGQTPLEIGVAIDARTLEGTLPDEGSITPLALPGHAPAPYRFVLFDWNPHGHEREGVYKDVPHFDFHFYFTPLADVQAITPNDPAFAAKANNLPTGDFVPPYYVVPIPPWMEPAMVAEPGMGVHWNDVRSPEFQQLFGNPGAYQPFTKTFIYGSWDGRFTFVEPMVTREYLLRRTDEVIPVPQPARYPEPGWYASAYRITYDRQAREYRVALVGLSWRE